MGILIDGYNLLFTIGLPRGRRSDDFLEQARRSLLDLVADRLDASEIEIVVVFDAKQAPSGRASEYQHRGISVRFAQQEAEADDLLEALIQREPHPDQLLVVSSDRRVQAAASRRKAVFIDSEKWLEELRESDSRNEGLRQEPKLDPRQQRPDSSETEAWLREFDTPRAAPPQFGGDAGNDASEGKPEKNQDGDEETWNPFPPGYGEDLG